MTPEDVKKTLLQKKFLCTMKDGRLRINSNYLKNSSWKENLIKEYPDLEDFFRKFSKGNSEMVYCLNNNLSEPPKCPYCDSSLLFIPTFCSYCKTCGKKECADLERKRTCFDKYGVSSVAQLDEIKNQKKQTCLERYGTEYALSNREIIEKRVQSNLKNHNGIYATATEEIREKTKKTNIEKYGYDHPLKSKDIRNKQQETCFKNNGYCFPGQSPTIKEKIKESCLEKYGVENARQSEEVSKRIEETNIRKYGSPCVFCNEDIKLKIRKTLENLGKWIPLEEKSEFERYYSRVWVLTNQTYKKYKEEINPSDLKRGNPNEMHQLDHKYSIVKGFEERIPEEIIASKINLEIIGARDNKSKGKKCSITKEELLSQFSKLE